ncbi:MAG: gliding motility-associated C-terminal domain-containing protein [Bacteroidia bacterium]|nr:gliding motility-associated C-terminal domain-containing protein [Bacteroidia bacterium]MDW8157881.1 gliding motility-associated C-terminal domain-containing protein [Bacteroidia bacterium]
MSNTNTGGWQLSQRGDACHAKWYISDREPGRPTSTPCTDYNWDCLDKTLHIGQNDNFLCQDLTDPRRCGDCGAWQIESSVGCPRLNYSTQAEAISPVIRLRSATDSIKIEFDFVAGLRGACGSPTGDYAQVFFRTSTNNGASFGPWINLMPLNSPCLPRTSSCPGARNEVSVITNLAKVLALSSDINALQLRFTWNSYDDCNGVRLTTLAVDNIKVTAFPRGGTLQVVNAGGDQFRVCQRSTWLNAATPGGTWSQLSGPAATIQSPNQASTFVTGLLPNNTYLFEWKIGTACDVVVITTNSGTPPNVNAGPDQVICTNNTTLNATAPAGANPRGWRILQQPAGASATFSNPSAPNTRISNLNQEGDYVLEWLAFSGCCVGRDTVIITVKQEAPNVFAGNDTAICGESLLLRAAPVPATVVAQWSILEQPAGSNASIQEPSKATTSVNNLIAGEYKFLWQVNDDCNNRVLKDTLIVKVTTPSFSFSVGQDSTTCLSTLSLWATPLSSGLSGNWLVLQQPDNNNPAIISESNKPNARIFLPTEGVYKLLWKVTDGTCTLQDTLTINYDKNSFRLDTASLLRPICTSNNGEIRLRAISSSDLTKLTIAPNIGEREGGFIFKRLPEGTYVFEAENKEGCKTTLKVKLESIQPNIAISEIETQPASCRKDNGALKIEAVGGVEPYTYQITHPIQQSNTTGIFTNLSAALYWIEVSDRNGCKAKASFDVPTKDFEIKEAQLRMPKCHGSNDGQIVVSATGATEPFLYTLEPGNITNTTGIFDRLKAGSYTVTVLDRNTCSIIVPLVLEAPLPLNLKLSLQAPGCTTTDGKILFSATGGTPPYTCSLLPSAGQFTDTAFINLPAGAYSLKLQDQKGCTLDTLIALNPPSDIQITISPNDIIPASCKGRADGQILIRAHSMVPIRFYSIFPEVGNNLQNGIFTDLPAGKYLVTVTNAVGCKFSKEVIVPEKELFEVKIISKADLSCAQSQDGAITLQVRGNGIPPFLFSIDGGINTVRTGESQLTYTGLDAGEYIPWVKDRQGCIVQLPPIVVSAPLPLSWDVSYSAPNCVGVNNGKIIALMSGGTPPYTFILSDQSGVIKTQDKGEFLNLAPGEYGLEVKDDKGCSLKLSEFIDLRILDPLSMEVVNIQPPICAGQATASIQLKVKNARAPWKVMATPGNQIFENTENLTALKAGKYWLVLRDASGCEYTLVDSVNIPSPLPLKWESFVATSPACYNGADGSLKVNLANANSPVTFTLKTSEGQEVTQSEGYFENLKASRYLLRAVDVKGCQLDTTFILVNPLPIIISPSDTLLCVGQTGGKQIVPLVAKQGSTILREGSWSGAGVEANSARFNSSLVNDAPGKYTVQFTSSKGCIANATIQIINLQVQATDTVCFGSENYKPPLPNLVGGSWRAGNAAVQINPQTGNVENIKELRSDNYLLIYEADGCQDTLVLYILPPISGTILTTPSEDALYPNQPITMGIVTQEEIRSVFWDGGILHREDDTSSRKNPVFTYPEKGNYTVKVWITNTRGCKQLLEKQLAIKWLLDPFIPNVITPNGDGVNDGVELNFSSFVRLTFTVYDAWGKQIFQTQDPKGTWFPRKEDLSPGTYYYLLQFENPENNQKHTKTGNIAIIY